MAEDVCPLPGAGQNHPLPLLLPPLTFRLSMIYSMVVFAPDVEVAKYFHGVRLATNNHLVSVDAVVGVEVLATAFADKHMATELPYLC